MLIALLILLVSATAPADLSHKRPDKIDDKEAQAYLNQDSGCDSEDAVTFYTMKHVNLTHDGRDNLIVVASTCMTGTAGPDIHTVLSRDDDGHVIELPFGPAKMPKRRVLFGNSNSDEDVQEDELVSTYSDTSDREAPLVIRYKWDGKQFKQTSILIAKPFPASYNCENASEEVEQAICANETVAKLDRDLNALYVKKLRKLPPERRETLREQQRSWIRDRNKECVVYKWWVECLTEMYTRRIAELK
jgi:uncharacterized protein YecT (DUF1311 family)